MDLITIQEAIDKVDLLKPNAFPPEQKKEWLSNLDKKVWHEIYLTHEGQTPVTCFTGYNQDTDTGTKLLVPEPYTDVYLHWMSAQMDLANMESAKYAQNRQLFNAAYQDFGDFWRRTHMPKMKRQYIRF